MSISFIIPAYNAEKTLEKTVSGVFASGDAYDIEVLIVENGSTDQTSAIAEALSRQHRQVKVLHSEKGVSNARNTGLRHATGDWIFFLDADDEILEDALAVLQVDSKDDSTDLYLYSYKKGSEEIRMTEETATEHTGADLEKQLVSMLENPTRCMAVWGKLFRRSRIIAGNIFFRPELSMAEDSEFLIRYLVTCQKITARKPSVYRYQLDDASSVRRYDGTKAKKYMDSLEASRPVIAKQSEAIQHAFWIYVLMHLNLVMVHEVFSESNPASHSLQIGQLKGLVGKGIFQEALSHIKLTECKSARMATMAMLKMKNYGMCAQLCKVRIKQNSRRA